MKSLGLTGETISELDRRISVTEKLIRDITRRVNRLEDDVVGELDNEFLEQFDDDFEETKRRYVIDEDE
jgi:predicted  nucleic acid-binding Zn-ribbon protein